MEDPRFELPKPLVAKITTLVRRSADCTRNHILESQRRGFTVEQKADFSLVTPVDKECEEKVRAMVASEFPEHGFLGEEFGHTKRDADLQWAIDPIDGTADFTRGMAQFGTVLGVFYKQQPLAGLLDFPNLDLRLWATFRNGLQQEGRIIAPSAVRPKPIIAIPPRAAALRAAQGDGFLDATQERYPDYRTFWTCLSYGLASCGALDAAVEIQCKIWDVASAEILATEGGKKFAWLEAPKPWASGRCSTVTGDPAVVDDLLKIWSDRTQR